MTVLAKQIGSKTTADVGRDDNGGGRSRDELMNVATRIFAQKGFRGTSIRDIAEAHGVSVSNIYHHFGNKEGLWLAIIEQTVKDLPRQLTAAAQSQSEPVDRLRDIVRTHLEFIEHHQQEVRIFFVNESMLSPDGAKIIRNTQKKILDIYMKEISSMKELGLLRIKHVKITCLNILALVNWHLRWFRVDGHLPPSVLQSYIIDFVLNGILTKRR